MLSNLLNCWEIRQCGREKGGKNEAKHGACPVSMMDMGHSCWIIAGSFHDGAPYCPQVKDYGLKCTQCEVFKLYRRAGGPNSTKIQEKFPDEHMRYIELMLKKNATRDEVYDTFPSAHS